MAFKLEPLSGLNGFEDTIEVQSIAELEKLVAKLSDMHGCGNIDGHLHRKHRRTRVCGGVSSGCDIGNFNIPGCEEIGKIKDNALLIQAEDIHRVGYSILFQPLCFGLADCDREVVVIAELFKFFLESRQGVPIARDQHEHRELRAKCRHAAFFDISTAG